MEAVQYGGGLASVQWRDNNDDCGGTTLSIVEAIQYSGGLTSVQ